MENRIRHIKSNLYLNRIRKSLLKQNKNKNKVNKNKELTYKEISNLYKQCEGDYRNELIKLCRNIFKREYGITPYIEQELCAVALSEGNVCEMKTGEGKTVSIILSAVLLSITGKVHIVTTNEYLAKRDYEYSKKIFDKIGLKVGFKEEQNEDLSIYRDCDIVYASSACLAFDYLRDELNNNNERYIELNSIIIDEIDFVLLDNAQSTFSLSRGVSDYLVQTTEIEYARNIVNTMKGIEVGKGLDIGEEENNLYHYAYDIENEVVMLTDLGIEFINEFFHTKEITDEHENLYRSIIKTLEVDRFYENGKHYIVQDGYIRHINKDNGRIMLNTKVETTTQTIIEFKEKAYITSKPLYENYISYQILFNKYKMVCGTSGTIETSEREIECILNTECIYIPTHKKCVRKDFQSIITKTKEEKITKILEEVKTNLHRPIMIVTNSDNECDEIYRVLNTRVINTIKLDNSELLNEEYILNKSGKNGMVLVTTNMSGRGTDIEIDKDSIESGGLHVIVTEHFYNRRVDNQIKGRAGRQGNQGSSIFIVSLEDDIFKKVNVKEFEKIKTLSGDKLSQKVNKIILKTQKENEYNLYKKRVDEYTLSKISEIYRRIIINKKPLEDIDLDNIMAYLNGKAHKHEEEFYSQINVIGRENSEKLLQEILKYLYKELVDNFYVDSENLKSCIKSITKTGDKVDSTFILEMSRIYNENIEEFYMKALDMFVRARVEI